jgi:hypothetical protein
LVTSFPLSVLVNVVSNPFVLSDTVAVAAFPVQDAAVVALLALVAVFAIEAIWASVAEVAYCAFCASAAQSAVAELPVHLLAVAALPVQDAAVVAFDAVAAVSA